MKIIETLSHSQYTIPVLKPDEFLPNNTISVAAGSKDSPLTARATWRNVRSVFELNFSLLTVNVELQRELVKFRVSRQINIESFNHHPETLTCF